METATFPNAAVQQEMKGFICVFADSDREQDLKKKYVKEGVPSNSVLNKDGKVVDNFEGFLKPDEFVSRLKRSEALAEGKEPPPAPPSDGEGD